MIKFAFYIIKARLGGDFCWTDVITHRAISNWTLCHTNQGIIVLVISNWPRTLHSSDFEITPAITPELYSIQSNYYY